MSDDLFPATLESKDLPSPKRGLDLRTEYLKEVFELEAEWEWHSFEALEDRPPFRFAKYKGGVYPFAKSRGKYKGQTDYKRPKPETERTVVLDNAAFEAWTPIWEKRTGLCADCRGTGQKWTGWNYKTGNSYCDCGRCAASGTSAGTAETGTGSGRSPQARPDAQTPSRIDGLERSDV